MDIVEVNARASNAIGHWIPCYCTNVGLPVVSIWIDTSNAQEFSEQCKCQDATFQNIITLIVESNYQFLATVLLDNMDNVYEIVLFVDINMILSLWNNNVMYWDKCRVHFNVVLQSLYNVTQCSTKGSCHDGTNLHKDNGNFLVGVLLGPLSHRNLSDDSIESWLWNAYDNPLICNISSTFQLTSDVYFDQTTGDLVKFNVQDQIFSKSRGTILSGARMSDLETMIDIGINDSMFIICPLPWVDKCHGLIRTRSEPNVPVFRVYDSISHKSFDTHVKLESNKSNAYRAICVVSEEYCISQLDYTDMYRHQQLSPQDLVPIQHIASWALLILYHCTIPEHWGSRAYIDSPKVSILVKEPHIYMDNQGTDLFKVLTNSAVAMTANHVQSFVRHCTRNNNTDVTLECPLFHSGRPRLLVATKIPKTVHSWRIRSILHENVSLLFAKRQTFPKNYCLSDNCLICKVPFDSSHVPRPKTFYVTVCGHEFCEPCFDSLFDITFKTSKCPACDYVLHGTTNDIVMVSPYGGQGDWYVLQTYKSVLKKALQECLGPVSEDSAVLIYTKISPKFIYRAINVLKTKTAHDIPVWVLNNNYHKSRQTMKEFRCRRRGILFANANCEYLHVNHLPFVRMVIVIDEHVPPMYKWPKLAPDVKITILTGTKPKQTGYDYLKQLVQRVAIHGMKYYRPILL